MTRGVKNNNPGNIKISANNWAGKLTKNTDGVFEQFVGAAYGLRALFILLINYYNSGLRSVDAIITKYAPSTENNTDSYIQDVSKKMGVDRGEIFPLTQRNLFVLVDAICRMESGAVYDYSLLQKAFDIIPDSKKKELSIPA